MRASGILFPISSLPSTYGIGCFSKEAFEFVDFLEEAGQKFWQILPIGQTSYGDSPYQSFSTFAGNPYFVSLDFLIEQGFLTKEECDACDFGNNPMYVDYGKLYIERYRLLRKAYGRSNITTNKKFQNFTKEQSYWIYDYALFMALKDHFGGVSWSEWIEDVRVKRASVLQEYQINLKDEIKFYEYIQFEFFEQWHALKQYANKKGISIIGDIPIYVSFDSADAWANPELFQFDQNRLPVAVAGCPPDGFSATGQLWGNPLYQWDYHKKTHYEWWVRRIAANYEMYDVIRIDHFRGFDEYYSIPAKAKTAEHGQWVKGPGIELFQEIREQLGDLKVIVEDLGYINDSVREMVRQSGFPNMKVLEFAFDTRDSGGPSEYLPYNYDKNCVVYTGTHDNETLAGWLDNIVPEDLEQVERYLGGTKLKNEEMVRGLIRLAQSSTADLCIIPIQDYLGLGNDARINKPATIGNNWKWRILKEQMTGQLAAEISNYTKTYGRL